MNTWLYAIGSVFVISVASLVGLIAGSDLVPELRHARRFSTILLVLASIVAGVGVMAALTLME